MDRGIRLDDEAVSRFIGSAPMSLMMQSFEKLEKWLSLLKLGSG
jgi:hypothetical protein